jgi:two-component system, LytTR family, sensor kinase
MTLARHLRPALVVLGVAVAFGVLEAAQWRLLYPDIPGRLYWPESLLRTTPSWIILALLVPGIVLLARVVRVRRETWRIALPLHIVAGVCFTSVHIAGSAWVTAFRLSAPWRVYFWPMFARYAVLGLFIYGAIVAVVHALQFQAEARERALAASQLQTGLARAKLQFLRAQLQPHFLFNALNSISSMALNGERERVAGTVNHLSELLRRCLDESAAQEVTLAVELDLLEHYLELERTRFGDRLRIERRVGHETLDARVPSLLLQTLVENAVRHGIESRRGPGVVVVEARRDGASLHLEVRDSGPGFQAAARGSNGGVGLANTEARLEQLYGATASLERGAAPEGGARVTVRLPLRPMEAGA